MTRIAFLIGLLGLSCLPAFGADPVPVKPVHTAKSRFRIPYRYDAQEMARLQAREIRLYTSTDGGRRWEMSQAVAPQTQKFEFEAARDGEYWFSVKTLDGNNQLHPGGDTIEPGLKVIVDTVQPILRLNLRQSEAGRVELSWTAIDAHLDLDKLTLEYIHAGGREWQTIRVLPEATGQTSWSVPGGGIVAVRGSIADRSGNVATAQMQISVDPSNGAVPVPTTPDFRKPVAESPAGDSGNLARRFPGFSRDFPDYPTTPAESTNPQPWAGQPGIPVADQPATRPDTLKGRQFEPPPAAPVKPSGTVKLVNNTKFALGYQLQDVGPSGVARVELFITQDDGAHWWRYGEDEDRSSPFDVEVPIEGVYGFTMRVKSGAGLALDPPRNGDKPEISVIVDQSPPEVKLISIQPAVGAQGAQVVIRWSIADENPSPIPVSVLYAAEREGPWIPITGWQVDEGHLAWRVTPQIPPRVYIRIDARDAAGNTSSVTSEAPAAVDLSRPSARIVDIEPEIERELRN